MLVVSDTSPVTNLIQTGHLFILRELFTEVIIPKTVFEELCRSAGHKDILESSQWIKVKTVVDIVNVELLKKDLDPGEAEAIVLAKELKSDILIIDERKGRNTAINYGLRITGLLGVIIKAKKKGLISELKPLLDKLINEVNFRVSEKLYNQVLHEVNE